MCARPVMRGNIDSKDLLHVTESFTRVPPIRMRRRSRCLGTNTDLKEGNRDEETQTLCPD